MPEKLALDGGPKAITRADELAALTRWPVYSEEEKQAVLAALDDANVYSATAAFEQEFAGYLGVRYALACCNGSAALHSAYFAAGVGPGDEVITSPYTWHLQVGQILALHALPVFCDIDPHTGAIRPEEIEKKITPRTRAIAVVHPFGFVAPIEEIVAIGRAHGIPVIEDASHAHGATYQGRKIGTFGDIACFSFQASKLINAIEGGILVTNDARCYDRACALGHYERLPGASAPDLRRLHDPTIDQAPACFGFKYRMHPLGAAIARTQLRHLDEWNAIRRANLGYLTERLEKVGRGIFTPPPDPPQMRRTWLNYIGQFHAEYAGCPRETFLEALQAEGLPARGGRAGYLPIYWNPLYAERQGIWADGDPFDKTPESRAISYARGLCPEAETFWRRCIDLPVLHRPASRDLLEEIVEAVDKAVMNLAVLQKRAYPVRVVEPKTPRIDPVPATPAVYGAPAAAKLHAERITDQGGWRHSGGTGRCCWGYHQSNLVRHGEEVYALCWRDDTHLVVFRRRGPGDWEASPPLPESPQSGALLLDPSGRVHVICGEKARLHVLFDPPGQVQRFTVREPGVADTRFGAAMAPSGDLFVAGGMPAMRWYVLSAKNGYRAAAAGCLPHETNRAYYFTAFDGTAAQTYCTEVHYVEAAGFQTMHTWSYRNPDIVHDPDGWRMQVVSDVSDTFDGAARGATGNEDLFIDRKGRTHFLTLVNVTPATGAWAGGAQNRRDDRLYHAVAGPDGALTRYALGAFTRGRLGQSADGRLHYFLTRPAAGGGSEVWHAVGGEDDFVRLSEPTRLDLPTTIDHLFVNAPRAGGTLAEGIDFYFTGPYPGGTKDLFYGRLSG